jgi:hypothetical protein
MVVNWQLHRLWSGNALFATFMTTLDRLCNLLHFLRAACVGTDTNKIIGAVGIGYSCW